MRILATSLLFICCLHEPLLAQYQLKGLGLSFRGHAASWKLNEVDDITFDSHSGGGAGAEVFYGMSDIFGVFGRIDLSSVTPDEGESYTLTHFDIGLRLLPAIASRQIRPFAELAFSARSAEFDVGLVNLEVTGPGATVGLGALAFVAPGLGVSLGAAGTFGNMEEVTLGGFVVDASVKATSWRLAAGLVWFP